MKLVAVGITMFLGYVFLTGWALMIAVGIIHAEWIIACPTINFYWACIIAFFLRLAFYTFSGSGN